MRRAVELTSDVIRSTEEKLRSEVVHFSDAAVQSIDYCENCVRGCFGRICDRAEEIFSKCEKKIRNRIDDSIANSYYFTFQFFGPPPTTEEVLADFGVSTDAKPPIQLIPPRFNPVTKRMECPSGYEPIWDDDRHEWHCWPVCPPGFVRDPISKQCQPPDLPPRAEPQPPPPSCPVEYPPPPGGVPGSPGVPRKEEPPCPPPADLVCPPGQQPAFVNGRWKCVPLSEAPLPGEPGAPGSTVCPTGKEKDPCLGAGATKLFESIVPDWNRPDICSIQDTIFRTFKQAQGKLADVIPWKYDEADDTWIVPTDVHEALKGVPLLVRMPILSIGGAIVAALDAILPVIPKLGGCDLTLAGPFQLFDALLDLVEKYTGFRSNSLSAAIQYTLNFICPYQFPSQAELNQLFYAGAISEETWKCLTRAIGNYDYWAKLVRDVNRPQLTPDELAVAYFRGVLGEEEFRRELVERYGLPREVAAKFEKLKSALPGIGDLVAFMKRDVDDPKIVEKYGYDAEFREKFGAQIREWAKALGVPEQVFLYYWRAHWELPSPTQLYEMLRRLRADSLDPEARALALTKEEVAAALAANDVPKYWRDRLIAISYLPMTPSDAKQAYIEGAIDADTYRSIVKDSGRNEQHTQWIFELADRQKKRRTMNLVGGFSAAKVTSWFKIGAIDEAMARRLYLDAGLTDELAERAIRIAKTAIRSERIEQRIKIVRKRYLVGDLSPEQARALLLKLGAELNRVNELLEDWELEIQIRSKQVAAGVLCSWFYRRLITAEEYAVRLRRIGYQPNDVERIIAECAASSQERAFDRRVKDVRGKKILAEAIRPKKNGKKEPK